MFGAVEDVLINLKINVEGFTNVIGMAKNDLYKMQVGIERFGTRGERAAFGIRDLTHGMRGFRMEALGVMFFGMMLQQTFMGLLQPIMETFGVFDLLNATLQLVFLPIMVAIFPYILEFLNFFMALPEPVKLAIGAIVLIGAVLGGMLFLFGSLILGIGSLLIFGPVVWAFATAFGAAILSIAAPILAIGLIIAAFLTVMSSAWESNFMGMRDVVDLLITGVTSVFQGLWNILSGIFDMIFGLLTGDTDKAVKGFMKIFEGIVQFVFGLKDTLCGALGVIAITIVNFVVNILKVAWDLIVKGVTGFIGGIVDIVSGAFNSLTGKKSSGSKSTSKFNDFIWRPGQGAIAISPDDTIVGTKSGSTPGGGANIVNNFYGFTMEDLKRELDDRDRRIVDNIRRSVAV